MLVVWLFHRGLFSWWLYRMLLCLYGQKEVQRLIMKSTMKRCLCGYSVCAGAARDELSPEAPWPLIQSARLHIHCFLALMYYWEQAAVCAVTAWIKLCHSRFTAGAILFRCRPETVRGEDITLICQPWSLYLNVGWGKAVWRSTLFMRTRKNKRRRSRAA